ncbi:hypothetical protein ADIS_0772 [Lunatimonas lonarensis]|uniref:Uncharacterized protein n=1 Tax=Lunatimonas lonarensis TaxID=1232681 RepID=R7ZXI6_9BACT|nr:hypothetical protein ADIS_0772 [Lunatimonas lonarensis]
MSLKYGKPLGFIDQKTGSAVNTEPAFFYPPHMPSISAV